jgi:hypothetical protein
MLTHFLQANPSWAFEFLDFPGSEWFGTFGRRYRELKCFSRGDLFLEKLVQAMFPQAK